MELSPKETVPYHLAAMVKAVTCLHSTQPSDRTERLKKIIYALQASLISMDVVTHASIRRASTTMQTMVKKQRIAKREGMKS